MPSLVDGTVASLLAPLVSPRKSMVSSKSEEKTGSMGSGGGGELLLPLLLSFLLRSSVSLLLEYSLGDTSGRLWRMPETRAIPEWVRIGTKAFVAVAETSTAIPRVAALVCCAAMVGCNVMLRCVVLCFVSIGRRAFGPTCV